MNGTGFISYGGKFAAVIISLIALTGCGKGIETLANNILYPVSSVNKQYPVPATPPAGFGLVSFDFTAQDKTPVHVEAWTYARPRGSDRTIVYFHGNGENLQALNVSNFLNVMTELNANFIIIDYPSYGRSTGETNQYDLVTAAVKAIDWAKAAYPNNKLIVWGRSLGAGVATLATAQDQGKVSKLALTSAWTSFYDVALNVTSLAKDIPKDWLAANNYPSITFAPQIHIPVLMEHGTADTTIPFKFGQELKAAFTSAPSVKFVAVQGRNHNDMFLDQSVWQNIDTFIHAQ